MSLKTRLGKVERAINSSDDASGPHVCKACGRDQSHVYSIEGIGDEPEWPHCQHCPPPKHLVRLIIDGATPTLPPPPARQA